MKECFKHWDEIAARVRAARGVFVAFDYDGVLAPIAPRPELARMPEENRVLLNRLALHPRALAAIVSGRALANVRHQVGLDALLYAGNHGAEIMLNGKAERHIPLERYRALLLMVLHQLAPWLQEFPGLHLEDKGFGIGLHYREVAAAQVSEFQVRFALWARTLPEELQVLPAKMMYEVRPKVDWNKGSAVLRLWESAAPDFLPFCLGDDRTDEDGFIALQGRGINIFVGSAKESCAEYFLESTQAVTPFLERLIAEIERWPHPGCDPRPS